MSTKFRNTLRAINSNDSLSAFRALAQEGMGMSPAQWSASLAVAPVPAGSSDPEARRLLMEVRDLLGHIRTHTKPGKQYVGLPDGRLLEIEDHRITIKTP